MGGEQVIEQWDGGVRDDGGAFAQRLFPAGLEGGRQHVAHAL
jgi:hypothetical protein